MHWIPVAASSLAGVTSAWGPGLIQEHQTMFWLIVPVSPGHLGLPVSLHITHICPNKGAHSQQYTRTYRYTEVRTLKVHMVTHWHGHWHTQRHTNKNRFQCPVSCVIAIHAQAVRQRSKVFITIDVRIHNKKWWLNLLQPVLFKAELLSPSCCSLSLLGRGGCDD